MARVLLIHWNAKEGAKRAAQLKRAKHKVTLVSELTPEKLRDIRATPPEIFVIDLSRMPSAGGAIGTALRQQKGTRHLPLVFVGGEEEKTAAVRQLLPDAIYAEWRGIAKAVREAGKIKLEKPVVPGTMDRYAATPLVNKLGIRPGFSVMLINAPPGFERKLKPLPERVELSRTPSGSARLLLLFVTARAQLNRDFPLAARAMQEKGGIWIIWPKKGSSLAADMTQADVRQYGMASGFVDYKICAVDDTWSGLLFARRRG